MNNDKFVLDFLKLKPRRSKKEFEFVYKNYKVKISSRWDGTRQKIVYYFMLLGDSKNFLEISENTWWAIKEYYWSESFEDFKKEVLQDLRKEKLDKIDETK